MSSFGERLRYLRDLNNLTQKEIGALLGVGPAYISQLENGREQPSEQLILLLSKQFYVREEWLRTGNGPMEVDLEDLIAPILQFIRRHGLPAKIDFLNTLARSGLLDELQSRLVQWPITDPECTAMMLYIRKLCASEDPDMRAWLRVQFRKAFPDYQDYIKKDDSATMA